MVPTSAGQTVSVASVVVPAGTHTVMATGIIAGGIQVGPADRLVGSVADASGAVTTVMPSQVGAAQHDLIGAGDVAAGTPAPRCPVIAQGGADGDFTQFGARIVATPGGRGRHPVARPSRTSRRRSRPAVMTPDRRASMS